VLKHGIAALAAAGAVAGVAVAAIDATVKDYAEPLTADYETTRLLSVGDTVPLTSDPTKEFQMIGIPDGLGAHKSGRGLRTVYMNQELGFNALSRPVIGAARSRGAFVSKLELDKKGNVLSGEPAYDTVYLDDTLVGPAATDGNTTRAFARFCSGFLAGPEEGFDRYIYFANEEDGTPANTFDGKGGLSVAIVDGNAHGLTWLGHFPWENTLVQRGTGNKTVIMGMEDGPASQNLAEVNSQLWMYVGTKDRSPGATTLERNGLVGGKLYVFVAADPAVTAEEQFTSGSLNGNWVEIPGANLMDGAQLEAAADAVKGMAFARPEDGEFNPNNKNEFFWVTTGGAGTVTGTPPVATGANALGRIYSLKLNRRDPVGTAKLTIALNADTVINAGGDAAVSPDNIGVSEDYLMVQEDGTAQSRPVMAAKGRDGVIWRYKLDDDAPGGIKTSSATKVVTLSPPGRDGVAVGPGVWETSGIIDTDGLFGDGSWLFDVQAHGPTAAPKPDTVEDGQLLLLTAKDDDDHGHDD
jgi:Bacterial protein of unknown function (DUF839)